MNRILTTLSQKWPEYLLEILVLIVGIYGAFALESWNERRNLVEEETKIIGQLVEQYELNLQQLESKIEMREIMLTRARVTLDLIDHPDTVTYDDLLQIVLLFFNDPTFDPIHNDLLNTGNLRTIRNDSLRELLGSWNADVISLNEFEFGWQKTTQETITPYFSSLGLMRDIGHTIFHSEIYNRSMLLSYLSDEEKKVIDYPRSTNHVMPKVLLSDPLLESFAITLIGINTAANIESRKLKKKMERTLKLMKKEIQ